MVLCFDFKALFDVAAFFLYRYVACGKAVENCMSVVGGKWWQLEIFVVFIINWSSSNSNYQEWYVTHDSRN